MAAWILRTMRLLFCLAALLPQCLGSFQRDCLTQSPSESKPGTICGPVSDRPETAKGLPTEVNGKAETRIQEGIGGKTTKETGSKDDAGCEGVLETRVCVTRTHKPMSAYQCALSARAGCMMRLGCCVCADPREKFSRRQRRCHDFDVHVEDQDVIESDSGSRQVVHASSSVVDHMLEHVNLDGLDVGLTSLIYPVVAGFAIRTRIQAPIVFLSLMSYQLHWSGVSARAVGSNGTGLNASVSGGTVSGSDTGSDLGSGTESYAATLDRSLMDEAAFLASIVRVRCPQWQSDSQWRRTVTAGLSGRVEKPSEVKACKPVLEWIKGTTTHLRTAHGPLNFIAGGSTAMLSRTALCGAPSQRPAFVRHVLETLNGAAPSDSQLDRIMTTTGVAMLQDPVAGIVRKAVWRRRVTVSFIASLFTRACEDDMMCQRRLLRATLIGLHEMRASCSSGVDYVPPVPVNLSGGAMPRCVMAGVWAVARVAISATSVLRRDVAYSGITDGVRRCGGAEPSFQAACGCQPDVLSQFTVIENIDGIDEESNALGECRGWFLTPPRSDGEDTGAVMSGYLDVAPVTLRATYGCQFIIANGRLFEFSAHISTGLVSQDACAYGTKWTVTPTTATSIDDGFGCDGDSVPSRSQCANGAITGDGIACLPASMWVSAVDSDVLTFIAYPALLCGLFGVVYEYIFHGAYGGGRGSLLARTLIAATIAIVILWTLMSTDGWTAKGFITIVLPVMYLALLCAAGQMENTSGGKTTIGAVGPSVMSMVLGGVVLIRAWANAQAHTAWTGFAVVGMAVFVPIAIPKADWTLVGWRSRFAYGLLCLFVTFAVALVPSLCFAVATETTPLTHPMMVMSSLVISPGTWFPCLLARGALASTVFRANVSGFVVHQGVLVGASLVIVLAQIAAPVLAAMSTAGKRETGLQALGRVCYGPVLLLRQLVSICTGAEVNKELSAITMWLAVWVYSTYGLLVPILFGVLTDFTTASVKHSLKDVDPAPVGPLGKITDAIVKLQGFKPAVVSTMIKQFAVEHSVKATSVMAALRSALQISVALGDGLVGRGSGLQLGTRHVISTLHNLGPKLARQFSDNLDSNNWVTADGLADAVVRLATVAQGEEKSMQVCAAMLLEHTEMRTEDGCERDGVVLFEVSEDITERAPANLTEVRAWFRDAAATTDDGLMIAAKRDGKSGRISNLMSSFEYLEPREEDVVGTGPATIYSSAAEHGYSGCALLSPETDGSFIFAGVHAGALDPERDTVRVAFRLSGEERKWIRDAVASAWPKDKKHQAAIADSGDGAGSKPDAT